MSAVFGNAGAVAGGSAVQDSIRVFALPSRAELTIIVPTTESRDGSWIMVTSAVDGADPRVECFGAPVVAGVRYTLSPGTSYNLYAWSQASVSIQGSRLLRRNTIRTTIPSMARAVAEYHCMIDASRAAAAAEEEGSGPAVLICGGSGVGKHSVARSLCNYAARTGWTPTFVDLDCGPQQTLVIPGTVAAAAIEQPIAIEESLSVIPVSVSFFVGVTEAQQCVDNEYRLSATYTHFADKLMDVVAARQDTHRANTIGKSGVIIVAPELRGFDGMQFLKGFIDRNDITHVMCIGDDTLFHLLHMKYHSQVEGGRVPPEGGPYLTERSKWLHIDKMTPSSSALPLCSSRRTGAIVTKLHNYFLGSGSLSLQPSEHTRPYANMDILYLTEQDGRAKLEPIEESRLETVVGCVGALFDPVMAAKLEKDLLGSAPFGYARVQSVGAKHLSFRTTVHEAIPSGKLSLVVGNLRWLTG